jgi:hypothetical protein
MQPTIPNTRDFEIIGAFLLHQNSDIFAQISLVHLCTVDGQIKLGQK